MPMTCAAVTLTKKLLCALNSGSFRDSQLVKVLKMNTRAFKTADTPLFQVLIYL